jgi:dihydroorotate dehydrogenase (NAD+) catalytic subunit
MSTLSGNSPESYAACAARIDALESIPAIELNISCPQRQGGRHVVRRDLPGRGQRGESRREVYHKTLIVKLSPNVTASPTLRVPAR